MTWSLHMCVIETVSARKLLMWLKLHRIGSATLVAIVATQAVIAGQYIFGAWGIDIHAALGNAAFSIAVVLGIIARWKLAKSALWIVALAIAALLTAQIGLGYSSRESVSAAALHIPLGVTVFGAVVYQLLASWPALVPRRLVAIGEVSTDNE